MNLKKIIMKIASHPDFEKLINENIKIKEKFGIAPNEKAFSEGSNSVVYENKKGNIVTFISTNIMGSSACEQAYKAVGRNSKVLPEIYDLEYISIPVTNHPAGYFNREFCVIEMEKLEPIKYDSKEWFATYSFLKSNIDDLKRIKYYNDKHRKPGASLTNIDKLTDDVIELLEQMKIENITHLDLHPNNIAYGRDGKLHLIDWEAIFLK